MAKAELVIREVFGVFAVLMGDLKVELCGNDGTCHGIGYTTLEAAASKAAETQKFWQERAHGHWHYEARRVPAGLHCYIPATGELVESA